MAEVAKAAPDGHTLALSAISPLTLSPHLMKLPYDPFKDIVAVAPMMYSPVYVLATSAFTGKSWQDLVTQAKTKPGSVRIATSGVGSVGHIIVEQIQAKTGAQFIHVPYKGVGQTVTDAVGGHFEIMMGNPFPTINNLIEQGKLRVLATTGPQRAPNQPTVATLAELGVPEANLSSIFGFMAPAGTPADVVEKINALVQEWCCLHWHVAQGKCQQRSHHSKGKHPDLSVPSAPRLTRAAQAALFYAFACCCVNSWAAVLSQLRKACNGG